MAEEKRRDEVRADGPEVIGRAPGKKDKKRWCKGKVGRPHQGRVQERSERTGSDSRYYRCHPSKWRKDAWVCCHELVCTGCGKVLRWQVPDLCPKRPPDHPANGAIY